MTVDKSKLPPIPKERDYPQTPQGAMEYARDLSEWLRNYTDATDDHRKRGVETWTEQYGQLVAQHETDLQPGTVPRPGWVARDIQSVREALERFVDQVAEDNQALVDDNKRIRSYLKWAILTSASALVSLLVFLAGQFVVKGMP